MIRVRVSWGLGFALAALVAAAASCQDRDVTVQLRSLNRSRDVSYVCADGITGEGVPLSDCTRATLENGSRNLIALITQTSTGEVALVNVPIEPDDLRPDEGVIDVDPSTPGYGFLRVGAHPEDIVSTPDGEASFVSSADAEKPGIFALPTTCLGPPRTAEESVRDLTTWAACALPTPPGKMELVFEPHPAEGARAGACPSTLVDNPPRTSPEENLERSPSEDDRHECKSNLLKSSRSGRWKLLVTLPDSGSLAVVDAQALLDRDPGTFAACPVEATYLLTVDLPVGPIEQRVPDDLKACTSSPSPTRPPPPAFTPHPSDLALANDVLYVADDQAPVIHRLDVSRPCAAAEMPPLLPVSFDDPTRTVTTSNVAVSPLTPAGKRFVYAVDRYDLPASSLMVFDVSPDSTDRTPIVRPGSADIPGETPDRLRLGAPIRDVTFIERDRPSTTSTVTLTGQACNPTPDKTAPGADYQPDNDVSEGVSTSDLRGVFAMALLSNGQIAVIDVEDFDAPCRRPAWTNTSPDVDFHGCANDPQVDNNRYAYKDGTLSVTGELSCRMVEPHRRRAASLGLNSSDAGIHAPALQSFPQLDLPESALALTVPEQPKMLAVDFPVPIVENPSSEEVPSPVEVYVGTTRYSRDSLSIGTTTELVIDPAVAKQQSLTLPFVEPRAYIPETTFVTYEGRVTPTLSSGIFETKGGLSIHDPGVSYCEVGVKDIELMRELGARRFQLSGRALEDFARTHADAVWITDDFLDEDDPYWKKVPASRCARERCEERFGAFDADELKDTRRFYIDDATADALTLRGEDPDFTQCCFPSATKYDVRATKQWVVSSSGSGVLHDVVASKVVRPNGEPVFECIRDCNPRKRWDDPRVFEIACPEGEPTCLGAVSGDPCVLSAERHPRPDMDHPPDLAVKLDEPAARCIYSTPTARFAIYRGQAASAANMFFSWSVIGTFQALGLDLGAISTSVVPASIVSLPDLDRMTVIDSASLGLVQVDLEDLQTLTPTTN